MSVYTKLTAAQKQQRREERFWNYVDKNGPSPLVAVAWHPELEGTKCWLWTGCKHTYGYGLFGVEDQKMQLAHRYAYFLTQGHYPYPQGLHKCDNPSCCNPEHIFEGNDADNVADMMSKGRANTSKGSKAGHAKLNENKVLKIRELFSAGHRTKASLAEQFSIDPSVISRIISRKKWKHI